MSKTRFFKEFSRSFGETPKDFFTEQNPLFAIGADGAYINSTEDAAHLLFEKNGKNFKFSASVIEP